MKPLLNYPYTYRTLASVTQFNCADEKAQSSKTDNFDAQGNLVFINSLMMSEFNVKDGTVVGILRSRLCGATATNIAGTYEGTLATNYKRGGQEEREDFDCHRGGRKQINSDLQNCVRWTGERCRDACRRRAKSISLQSTTPGCAGSYEASFKFADDTVTFSFKGEDCGGPMEGNGTAKRVKA